MCAVYVLCLHSGLQRWQQWKGKESRLNVWTHRSESLLRHYSCLRSCVRVRLTKGGFVTINPDDQLDCAEQRIGDYSSPNPSLSVSLSHQLEPRWNKRDKERTLWYSLFLSLYPTSFCFSLLPIMTWAALSYHNHLPCWPKPLKWWVKINYYSSFRFFCV